MKKRPLRYKGVPQPGWMSDLLGALFAFMLGAAVFTWLLDELRRLAMRVLP